MMGLKEMEEEVLHLTGILGPEAYPLRLVEEIEAVRSKAISIATIHSILYKLENRGLLRSIVKHGTPERGGRRKRVYATTPSGRRALETHWELHGIGIV